MKLGRNDPCHCGSGKKYKRCCMDKVAGQRAELVDDLQQIVAMNPHLTLDELNAVTERKVHERNHRPDEDFCGLSPAQMANWLYAPFNELAGVSIHTPKDLSSSPVMRYLALILDEAIQHQGSFKATGKGNLPLKLVKRASDLLPEFAVAQHLTATSIHEFAGSNEERFTALHYTRILATIAGIIDCRGGRYCVEKTVQHQYQNHGVKAFFTRMLEVATQQFNWGYFDRWGDDIDLRTFWLFMLWRLQSHANLEQLTSEVVTAFPDALLPFSSGEFGKPFELQYLLITLQFVERFLQFWGFVTLEPDQHLTDKPALRKVQIQPLLEQTFRFTINIK